MAHKINQARPEGITHPEIRPGDKWHDKTGTFVSVTGYAFNRVTYVRDGYEHLCIFPVDRFLREFTHMAPQTFSEWRATTDPLEKTRKLRAMINARREGTQ